MTKPIVHLGDVADFKMGQAPPGKSVNALGSGVPFYRSGEFGLRRPATAFSTTDPLRESNSSDVWVCVVGANAGDINLGANGAIGRSVAAVTPRGNLDQLYLYYFLKFREPWLRRQATGSVQPVLSRSDLSRIELSLPSINEQRKIGEVLNALDELVEVNNSQVGLYAQLMRTLHAKLVASASKEVDLTELVNVISGGTPKTSEAHYWNGGIPWFSVVDAPDENQLWVTTTARNVSQEGIANSATQILPFGTTIISARGTVGKLALTSMPMAMNQSCFGLKSKGKVSDLYVFFCIENLVRDFKQKSHGSVFDTINRDAFKKVIIPFGDDENFVEYQSKMNLMGALALELIRENETLMSARDQLLPLLMSGKARVGDISR